AARRGKTFRRECATPLRPKSRGKPVLKGQTYAKVSALPFAGGPMRQSRRALSSLHLACTGHSLRSPARRSGSADRQQEHLEVHHPRGILGEGHILSAMEKTMVRVLLGLVGLALVAQVPVTHVQAVEAKAALTGQVTSMEEGPMEGVLVSAKQDGSTVTATVVGTERGRYSFPATRIRTGHYTISIRAVGYDLDGSKTVDVNTDK